MMVVVSGLVYMWQYGESWAVWCALALGFITSPLLTAGQVQEGDYVALEKPTVHVTVSSL